MKNERLMKLKELLEKKPDDSFLLFAVAKEYEKLNEAEKAIETYELIIHKNPDYTGTYLHLGKLYELAGDIDNAKAIYRNGILVCKNLNANNDLRELQNALNNI
jgi:tetratricopeptide (TPR) repeat protein